MKVSNVVMYFTMFDKNFLLYIFLHIAVKYEDLEVGTLVDVVDYMSKWTNAIVTKAEDDWIQVVVDGDLEMELMKEDIVCLFVKIIQSCLGKENN